MLCNRNLILLLALLNINVQAAILTGRVVGITDGDTVTILDASNVQHKIRLGGIDAPERGQPYGKKSKQHLSSLIAGKTVNVGYGKKDRYGRIVGKILFEGCDINIQQVQAGLAWHYKKYQHEQSEADQSLYAESERVARSALSGLWQEPAPIPPWAWREGQRSNQKQIQDQQATATMECGTKQFCKQMASCKEARFFLTECGLDRLDSDKDGIPCESLCKQ